MIIRRPRQNYQNYSTEEKKELKAICVLKGVEDNKRPEIASFKGIVEFSQKPKEQVLVKMKFENLYKNSVHAIHIHEFGNLTGGCQTLGAHYNPGKHEHGSFQYPQYSRHAGDLINNIFTDSDGKFTYEYYDPSFQLRDILGRSVVLHEGRDDLGQGGDAESKKTGNAKGRIMCGIIGLNS
jgi:Cu/Zn superoxide dismutase